MAETNSTTEYLLNLIHQAIDNSVKKLVEEEYEEAEKRIKARKSEVISGTVLDVMSFVSVQDMSKNIVITVKKDK